jgi:hypothetical protein
VLFVLLIVALLILFTRGGFGYQGASGSLPAWKVPWRRRNERSLADTHGRRDGSRRNRGRRSSRAGGAFRDRVDARRSEASREAAW